MGGNFAKFVFTVWAFVSLQVKVTGKKMMKIFKVFFGWVFKVKVAILLRKIKLEKKCWGCGCPLSWAPCCETWLKFEVKGFRCSKKKNVWVVGYPVSWAPCCE